MATKGKGKKRIGWIIAIILVVAAVAGVMIARKMNSKKKTEDVTYTVKKETYENVIEISGNVKAAKSQTLQASGSGTVTGVYVKEGDVVKKGQLIMVMDTTEQEYSLAKQDYDIAQKKINGSPREIELLEKQRAVLNQKLEDRKVVAYFDGVIAQLTVSVGDYLEAKDSVGVLIDRSYLSTSVEVVETDASKLVAGQVVHFTFPAYSGTAVDGYVVSYPSVGRITTRGATVVDVDIRIDNPPEEILPNYSFTGNIEIKAPETVVLVERQAIGFKAGSSFAEVINKDGTIKQVTVAVSQYDSTYVSIQSGLNEGDVLKAQSTATASGRLRVNKTSGSASSSSGNPGNGGMGGMGGGMMGGGAPGMMP